MIYDGACQTLSVCVFSSAVREEGSDGPLPHRISSAKPGPVHGNEMMRPGPVLVCGEAIARKGEQQGTDRLVFVSRQELQSRGAIPAPELSTPFLSVLPRVGRKICHATVHYFGFVITFPRRAPRSHGSSCFLSPGTRWQFITAGLPGQDGRHLK